MHNFVELTHPDLPGRSAFVHPRTVPGWERAGWARATGEVADTTDSQLPAGDQDDSAAGSSTTNTEE